MQKILCFDSSGSFLSVALACGDQILSSHQQVQRSHTGYLIKAIDKILVEAGININQLDALAFGQGPGSFTGIRIAASFAHGVAAANNLKLIPVSTLATLAQTGYRKTRKQHILAAIDAKIGEIYWAQYRITGHTDTCVPELIDKEQLSLPEAMKPQIVAEAGTYLAIGDGFGDSFQARTAIPETLQAMEIMEQQTPCAEDMLTLAISACNAGCLSVPEQAMPVYLTRKT